jgi:hypothetical protein
VTALLVAATLLGVVTSTVVSLGQTPDPVVIDPALEPIPVVQLDDGDKSIVIRVFFNTPTDVELISGAVSESRAPARIGGPPLIEVQAFDADDNVVEEHNDWHPLWTEVHGDHDGENGDDEHQMIVDDSGEGRFIVSYAPEIVTVKISDIELGQELIAVDAGRIIVDYCADKRDDPACAGVPCPGDVNGDGLVTLIDLLLVVRAFHSTPGDSTWNQRADINGDGRVDMLDLLMVVRSFSDARCR